MFCSSRPVWQLVGLAGLCAILATTVPAQDPDPNQSGPARKPKAHFGLFQVAKALQKTSTGTALAPDAVVEFQSAWVTIQSDENTTLKESRDAVVRKNVLDQDLTQLVPLRSQWFVTAQPGIPEERFKNVLRLVTRPDSHVHYFSQPADGSRQALVHRTDPELTGVWELSVPPGLVDQTSDSNRVRLVFWGLMQATFIGTQRTQLNTYAIDPTVEPKRLVLKSVTGGETRYGIYAVEQDGLKLNMTADSTAFPARFAIERPEFRRIAANITSQELDLLTSPGPIPSEAMAELQTAVDLAAVDASIVTLQADGTLLFQHDGTRQPRQITADALQDLLPGRTKFVLKAAADAKLSLVQETMRVLAGQGANVALSQLPASDTANQLPTTPANQMQQGGSAEVVQRLKQYQARQKAAQDVARIALSADQEALRLSVTQVFEARQALLRVEIEEFRQRLERLNRLLDLREKQKEKLIERRMQELLREHAELVTNNPLAGAEADTRINRSRQQAVEAGLDFLNRYAELQDLSLSMSEKEFKELIERKNLSCSVSPKNDETEYAVLMNDGHHVRVVFQAGKCVAILRRRGQPLPDKNSVSGPETGDKP